MELKDELRKGNLLYDRGEKILRIDWFEQEKICMKMEIDGQMVHPLTEDLKYVKPIPFTSNIAKNMGFEIYDDSRAMVEVFVFSTETMSSLTRFCVSFEKIQSRIFLRLEIYKGVWVGFTVMEIEYVHQFQNIFYDLTKQMPTIKN